MNSYEGMFIFSADSGPDARKEEMAALEAIVKDVKGKIVSKDEIGKKQLGYLINKSRFGFMVVCHLELDPSALGNFDRKVQLEAKVLKHMITVKNPLLAKSPVQRTPAPAKPVDKSPKEAAKA